MSPSYCRRPCWGLVAPKRSRDKGAFLSLGTHPCLPRGRGRDPTPPAPPPSPQAWLRSGAGWRESFSLNQYNLPWGHVNKYARI